jgi:integrase
MAPPTGSPGRLHLNGERMGVCSMSRKAIKGGVRPKGFRRIQFDFVIDGVRFRPSLPWLPTPTNLEMARKLNARIKAQIEAGTLVFSDVFPKFRGLKTLPANVCAKSCGEVFDEFLRHEEARVARGDLAPITVRSHRQILDHVWRPALGRLPFLAVQYSMMAKIADSHSWSKKTHNNCVSALRRAFAFGYLDHPERRDPAASLRCARIGKKDRPRIDPFSIQDAEVLIAALHADWGEAQGNYDEFRFFTGLRPSEQIALVVTDYDRTQRILSVSKARVDGIDKDCTKTYEDRRIKLCRRAVVIVERQLRLRERLVAEGLIEHNYLFFTDAGSPIPDVRYPYPRWERTLRRLKMRYRRPYAARHTSVSWNLMVGRNALLVAKEHGHRPLTMLTVYAAWTEGAPENDIRAIRAARNPKAWTTIRHCEATAAPVNDVGPISSSPPLRPEIGRTSRAPGMLSQANKAARANGDLALDSAPAEAAYHATLSLVWENHGGADGTRTRDFPNEISNLLYPKEGESPVDPYDPRVSHQISHYLRVSETRHYRPSRHCS